MSPQDRSAASRELILATAQELFHEYGYTATSLDRIVAGAGITKGSFYYHFESKEALAVEVIEWYRRQGAHELDYAGLEAMASPREALLVLLDRLVQRGHRALGHTRVCGCFFGNFALELSASSEAVRGRVSEVLEGVRIRIAALARSAQAAGELAPDRDCDGLASALLAIAEGAILLDKAEQSDRHSRAALEAVEALLHP